MPDTCNHTSVGVIAERSGRYLLFQRKKFPIAKAPSAGHVDELDGIPTGKGRREESVYLDAAVRELEEETGLRVPARTLRLALTTTAKNRCRRSPVDGGDHWHLWRVYHALIPAGAETRAAPAESADLAWYTPAEISALTDLEPVWRDFLTALRII
ncbi:NUDIX hydrolase [Thermomonospora umbrina]|uniref:ADP-ribose pyrophosphatase YjhB (NUDIX family) n=1 Tax=Thermomonospora umbrina TaxID=111806 RepID=A0A3D9SWK1_9ACTN|nr:NUDIX hydrolase [Thermomonospora umbrina]REF00333.1 ADP-ribose pyrophosphatase YjhB (NUDIX family) [Thermomonospora umbrina]